MGELLKSFVNKLAVEAQDQQQLEVQVDPLRDALTNPRIAKVVQLLQQHPILAEPTVQFIQQKVAEISMATLQALYTPAQIDQMKKDAGLIPK